MATELKKILVLERIPPGDRWSPVGDEETILDSLTEGLEYTFHKTQAREYFISALDGKVFRMVEEEKEPEPIRTYNIYGEAV
jgi:hypothetical protein